MQDNFDSFFIIAEKYTKHKNKKPKKKVDRPLHTIILSNDSPKIGFFDSQTQLRF